MMFFHNRYFARYNAAADAPGGGSGEPVKQPEAAKPDAKVEPDPKAEPKPEPRAAESDPVLQKLLQAERQLEAQGKELEAHRAKLKAHEREARKSKLLTSLREEFPGLPEAEIRGAALVAAEDGHIDLFSEDHTAALAHMKAALSPKAKKPTTSTASLGGSPGTPGKPATTTSPKFAI